VEWYNHTTSVAPSQEVHGNISSNLSKAEKGNLDQSSENSNVKLVIVITYVMGISLFAIHPCLKYEVIMKNT
jgi:hypothetical protein